MDKKYFQNRVDAIISESIEEAKQKALIKSILKENIREIISEGEANMKRKAVMAALKDPKYNHAEFARKLYHPKDKGEEDTYRSLFSKKATGKPDADGAVRQFSDDEINSLYNDIRKK